MTMVGVVMLRVVVLVLRRHVVLLNKHKSSEHSARLRLNDHSPNHPWQ